MMDKDRIQSAIDHIKTAVDLDPWAAELAVEALEHFREDTKNKQTNKQSDFADLVSRNLVLSEVKSGMIRTIDGEDWKRVSENVRGIRELPSAQPEIVKDLVTIFQNSKDMKLIARDGDLRADRIDAGRMPFEWIPCSERLPENGTIALVCGKKGGIRVARVFIPYATGNWNGDPNTNWWTIVGTGKPFSPIAWLPLPEPYEEKK